MRFLQRHAFKIALAIALTLLAIAFLFFPIVANAGDDDEYVAFGYDYRDDGGCKKAGHTYTAEYVRESDELEVHGLVQSAPSGGDCTQSAESYDFSISKYWLAGRGYQAFANFRADKRSFGAAYGLADETPTVLLRLDGMPVFSTVLPAGVAETIQGIIGVSRDFGSTRINLGFNVAPIDWADGSKGRTGHIGITYDLGNFDIDFSADMGEGFFGDVSASYKIDFTEQFGAALVARYAFGLNELDDGSPPYQTVNGATFLNLGSPSDTMFTAGVRLTYTPQ